MILTVAIILIAILIGFTIYQYNLRRDLQRSISVITQYMTREQDDFKPLLYRTDNQELQGMITSINTLLLQRYRLSRQYRDVQEQYRTNIADISHDLKTPITTLSGYIDLLILKYREFGNNSPEVNLALQKTKQKAQLMQHIILQQLDFARICSGDAEFPLKRINLTELCREIALSYYDCLNDNHFQVSLALNDPPIYASTSPDAIRCIMQNLIDNSIKYGESGRFLGIAISQNDQEIVIQISDHGPGIPPAEQKKIFDRNYQINKSDYASQGHAGLGLSIVEKIAARCHMSIQLESQPGATCFSIIVRKTLEMRTENDNIG